MNNNLLFLISFSIILFVVIISIESRNKSKNNQYENFKEDNCDNVPNKKDILDAKKSCKNDKYCEHTIDCLVENNFTGSFGNKNKSFANNKKIKGLYKNKKCEYFYGLNGKQEEINKEELPKGFTRHKCNSECKKLECECDCNCDCENFRNGTNKSCKEMFLFNSKKLTNLVKKNKNISFKLENIQNVMGFKDKPCRQAIKFDQTLIPKMWSDIVKSYNDNFLSTPPHVLISNGIFFKYDFY